MKKTLLFKAKLSIALLMRNFMKKAILIFLILIGSYPLLAQPGGVWVKKQLPAALPADKYYAVGENCLIYVNKNDTTIYAFDLISGAWHEHDQPTSSPWDHPARASKDMAMVCSESLAVVYSATSQTFNTLDFEGELINSTSSSAGTLTGCWEKSAYLVTDQYFYVFNAETGQWQSNPISGLGTLDKKYAYEEPGYVLITLNDESGNNKIIAYCTGTKQFFEQNYSFGIGIERLDYGFIVWSQSGLPDGERFFGCYSAIHNTWAEHYESEYSIVGASTTVKNLSPRTVFMFRVTTTINYPDAEHSFYIYNTLYPEPIVFSRTSNDDYNLNTFCVGAQTAVISFRNRSSNNLEIHSYQSDTHTMNPCIVSQLHVEQDFGWQSCGGKIYLGHDFDYSMGGYPNEQFTGYAAMPADYENTYKWNRNIEPRDDWGIMLFENNDADTAYVYSYNMASAETLTHFNTEWGNYSFLKMGYNNNVAALLANTDTGYKMYFYSPVFDAWTEKASGPQSPYLKLSGDFIYYLEPNSKLISIFNGATNQELDLPYGRTTTDLYTSSGENFLIAYTTDNKYVAYSAITGTSSEFVTDRRMLYGDHSICFAKNVTGIWAYNAISDAFVQQALTEDHGAAALFSPGDKTALVMTTKGYLFAFDPYRDIGTSVEDNIRETDSPAGFKLDQNYPNPFHTVTSISFFLPVPEQVKLDIFNSQGRQIRTLINKELVAGQHVIEVDSEGMAGGIYFYKLTAGNFQQSKKMLLLK